MAFLVNTTVLDGLPPGGLTPQQKRFGNDPWPQRLNESKSLYHSPSGTSGLVSTQSRRQLRLAMLIVRSRIRSIKCCLTPAGRVTHVPILGISCRRPFGPSDHPGV